MGTMSDAVLGGGRGYLRTAHPLLELSTKIFWACGGVCGDRVGGRKGGRRGNLLNPGPLVDLSRRIFWACWGVWGACRFRLAI